MPGPAIVPLTIACLLSAAAHQNIHPAIMWGLYKTEGGSIGSSVLNKDGSHDLGPLQINDRRWLPVLADIQFGGNMQLARTRVQYDGCYNAEVSAWIIHQYINEAHGDVEKAIGFYNSHTPHIAASYRLKFANNIISLYSKDISYVKTTENTKTSVHLPSTP